jgi:hypothetical protein
MVDFLHVHYITLPFYYRLIDTNNLQSAHKTIKRDIYILKDSSVNNTVSLFLSFRVLVDTTNL